MARKFNFQQAFTDSASAFAGGFLSGQVSKIVSENLPDFAEQAPIAPALLGFVLSQNKNKMISAAGLGMIGASSVAIAETIGIAGVTGIGARNRMNLTAAQRARMIQRTTEGMKVAGPDVNKALAGATLYN